MTDFNMFELDRFNPEKRVREHTITNGPQLIGMTPAEGWKAVFKHPTEGRKFLPLVGWGMWRRPDGRQIVVGMVVHERQVQPITATGMVFEDYSSRYEWQSEYLARQGEKINLDDIPF